jgi:hypothetical protein
MSNIQNINGLSYAQIQEEINRGGSFRVYPYVISIAIMTFRPNSDIFFVRAGESTKGNSAKYGILTFLLGWWGIPWGPIYTVGALYQNFSGGKNVTDEVMTSLRSQTNHTGGYNLPNQNQSNNTTGGSSGYNVGGQSSSGASNYNIR